MDVRQLKAHCARYPAATSRALGHPYNVLFYEIGGRQFAYFKLSQPEKWRFSFRVTADRFLELTDQPGIKPARYRGHHRWVTVVDVRTVPTAYLEELVAWSYADALGRLSKKRQRELVGDGPPRRPARRPHPRRR